MAAASRRFSRLLDGRVLDHLPAQSGGKPWLVLDSATGAWTPFDGILGQIMDSVPLTPGEEAEIISRFCSPDKT